MSETLTACQTFSQLILAVSGSQDGSVLHMEVRTKLTADQCLEVSPPTTMVWTLLGIDSQLDTRFPLHRQARQVFSFPFVSVPGGRVETWDVGSSLTWRVQAENDSGVHGQPSNAEEKEMT